MEKISIKSFLKYFGYVITLLSFIYIYFILKDARLELSHYTPLTFLLIILFCIVNSFFPFISAYAWKFSLEFVSSRKIIFEEAFTIYVKSNIAKYLPGNVMHYVGRNYIGVKYGWTNAQLALSSVLEVICLITVPFLLLSLFYFTGLWILPDPQILGLSLSLNFKIIALVSIVVITVLLLLFLYFSRRNPDLPIRLKKYTTIIFSTKFFLLLSKIFIISIISFFLNGILFYLIGNNLFGAGLDAKSFINISCSLTIAGYSGILTPGVPGGIGVKESISIILLSAYGFNKENMIMILIASRLFSIIGDLLAFAFVILTARMRRKKV